VTTKSAWDSFPDGLTPLAPHVGPFVHRPFLEALWRYRPDKEATLHVESSESGAVALVLSDGLVTFAGRSDLTDYHAPLGTEGVATLIEALNKFSGIPFRLDSLPLEALAPITATLADAGISYSVEDDESAAVLMLPATYEDWLGSLGKKQRHEVRRKRRRFAEAFGETRIERRTLDGMDTFATMHRQSAGDKGQFMTPSMQELFSELILTAGASIHLLACDGVARAAAFGFETDDGYYYYNSAYDPAAAMASPGVVLFSSMIETEIERGVGVFDFLKGDQQYKFRHGAIERRLFVITGRTQ